MSDKRIVSIQLTKTKSVTAVEVARLFLNTSGASDTLKGGNIK